MDKFNLKKYLAEGKLLKEEKIDRKTFNAAAIEAIQQLSTDVIKNKSQFNKLKRELQRIYDDGDINTRGDIDDNIEFILGNHIVRQKVLGENKSLKEDKKSRKQSSKEKIDFLDQIAKKFEEDEDENEDWEGLAARSGASLEESQPSITEGNIKGIGLKELESTEALRDYLEDSGYTINYKEGKTLFGTYYPSTISIFIKNSSSDDRLGNQHYIEVFAKDGELYLYGFRSINGEEINDRWFDGSLKNETPQGGLGSSHYFGTGGNGYEISPFAVEDILGDISKEKAKAGKAEADFYRDRGPVSGTID